jgi:hypothetical protein
MASYDAVKDDLFILGDCTDRGRDSIETLLWVMGMMKKYNRVRMTLGNHELMLEMAFEEYERGHRYRNPGMYMQMLFNNGGYHTFKQFLMLPQAQRIEILQFIATLPLSLDIGSSIYASHAGFNFNKPIDQQDLEDAVWSRDVFSQRPGPQYAGKVFIFGHTPTTMIRSWNKPIVWHQGQYYDIDCGASMGGMLAILEMPSGREYYI